jgi:hypothetical protein
MPIQVPWSVTPVTHSEMQQQRHFRFAQLSHHLARGVFPIRTVHGRFCCFSEVRSVDCHWYSMTGMRADAYTDVVSGWVCRSIGERF